MRDIKFRAWDKKFKHWCIQDDIRINPLNGNVHGKYSGGNVKEWILMQYTGLKDKNGVEIYEGDIVKWYIGGRVIISDIYYDERQASFWMGKHDGAYLTLNDWMMGEYEVIGNIYENPELLEQQC